LHGRELWRSDGTAAQTRLVRDINTIPSGVTVSAVAQLGDALLFSGSGENMVGGLWRTDGSLAGTSLVQELKPLSPVGLGKVSLFLDANASDRLWRSDGTPSGTSLLTSSVVRGPSVVGELALFGKSAPGCYACELWRSDGLAAGTYLLAPLPAPLDTSFVQGGRSYFLSGMDLWRTDGTPAGTVRVTAHGPNPFYSTADVEVVEGFAYFLGSLSPPRPIPDRFLWRTDGTEAGTLTLLSASRARMVSFTLVSHGRRVFFLAGDSEHGQEPWVSDGTVEGTHLLKDIQPGTGSSGGGSLRSSTRGGLLFNAQTEALGDEPWVSDGTPEGTVLLEDLHAGPAGSMPAAFATESGRVFFTADDGTHGRELWVSDGTREGTLLLGDLNPGPASSEPQQLQLPNGAAFSIHAGRVFFTADDGAHGRELWATDGTPEGTVSLGDLRTGLASSEVRYSGTWVTASSSPRTMAPTAARCGPRMALRQARWCWETSAQALTALSPSTSAPWESGSWSPPTMASAAASCGPPATARPRSCAHSGAGSREGRPTSPQGRSESRSCTRSCFTRLARGP
jgi:ELWxxDGT repeat protein